METFFRIEDSNGHLKKGGLYACGLCEYFKIKIYFLISYLDVLRKVFGLILGLRTLVI